MNLISCFRTLQDFKHTDLWSPLAPPLGETPIYVRGLFGMKFSSEQLLFEPFFHITCTFCSFEPLNESNFMFLYIIRIQPKRSLEPLAPLVGQIDKCACGLFCMKLSSKQLLFQAFSHVMHIFGSIEPQSEFNFPFLYVNRF